MKSITSILLILVMLSSSIGFTVGTHFCGGHAMESGIILTAHSLDCGMELQINGCDPKMDDATAISSTPCCQNEYQFNKIMDEYSNGNVQTDVSPIFAIAFVACFVPAQIQQQLAQPLIHYPPPPVLEKKGQILFQTFLI